MVAFYADSFGSRPSTICGQEHEDFTDAMNLSLSNVRRVLTDNDVSFEDVSAEQQRDVVSCGIFAMENAHRFALTTNLHIVCKPSFKKPL